MKPHGIAFYLARQDQDFGGKAVDVLPVLELRTYKAAYPLDPRRLDFVLPRNGNKGVANVLIGSERDQEGIALATDRRRLGPE